MPRLIAATLLAFTLAAGIAAAQELRIPLHKKSKYTPVQQLNRDGVAALQKHQIEKAKKLFYQAYLIDPDDPFTLNNLGYVSEIEGDVDRAQRYYDLARANTSDAEVDVSTQAQLQGKVVAKIAGNTAPLAMQVNQLNSQAMQLLNNDRAPEADVLLQQALKLAPNDPFTLNNLGFAREKQGALEDAIRLYSRAAATGSSEKIMVTYNKEWRGRAIGDVAAENARKAQHELEHAADVQDQVLRLNLQGVSALNRNDRKTAREAFEKAYKLDPKNAFTINNMGYLAELAGDKETAQTFYQQAQNARRANARVAVSTRREVEGRPMGQVAAQSTEMVEWSLESVAEAKRQTGAPPVLRTRDNRVVVDKPKPSDTTPETQPPK